MTCKNYSTTPQITINKIKKVEWKGLTGPIEFKEGRRVKFKLDLIKLKHHSVASVGEWLPQTGLNVTDRSAFYESSTMNVTLVVITILVSQIFIFFIS